MSQNYLKPKFKIGDIVWFKYGAAKMMCKVLYVNKEGTYTVEYVGDEYAPGLFGGDSGIPEKDLTQTPLDRLIYG